MRPYSNTLTTISIRALIIGLVLTMTGLSAAPAIAAPRGTEQLSVATAKTGPASTTANSNPGRTAGSPATDVAQTSSTTQNWQEQMATPEVGNPAHRPFLNEVTHHGMAVRVKVSIRQGSTIPMNEGEHALTELAVSWGDGNTSRINLRNRTVTRSSVFTLEHVYAYDRTNELDYQRYTHVVRLSDVSGNQTRNNFAFRIDPLFDVRISPLKFRPITKCDNYRISEGHGDFRVMWDHGEGQQASKELKAKKGRTRTVWEHAGDYRNLTETEARQIMFSRPDVAELDIWFHYLKFWNWDLFSEFNGVGGEPEEFHLGNHAVSYHEDGGGEAPGVANIGDNNCFVRVDYNYTTSLVTRIPSGM